MPKDENYHSEFHYLSTIIDALNDLYQNDYALLLSNRRTHEQTVSFRLAMYLAKRLEESNKGLFVDCEYHGDINSPERRKMINGRHIRPDILYHDRNWNNQFCIEMKIGSLVSTDYEKLNGLILAYQYHEAYGICNIGKNYVTIRAISKKHSGRGVKYRLHYDEKHNKLNRYQIEGSEFNEMSGMQNNS